MIKKERKPAPGTPHYSHLHLLALNTEFEAARAGEAGTSIALITDEIKRIAEKARETVKQAVKTGWPIGTD